LTIFKAYYFSTSKSYQLDFKLPPELIKRWGYNNGHYKLNDLLSDTEQLLKINHGEGVIQFELKPLESKVFQIQ